MLEEVVPPRVHGFDGPRLPLSPPCFHRFLAGDGLVDPLIMLAIDEAGEAIALAER
jgi:hypothetical protein